MSGGFLSGPFWISRDPTSSSPVEIIESTTFESSTSEIHSSTLDQTMIAGEPVLTSKAIASSTSTILSTSPVDEALERTDAPDQSTNRGSMPVRYMIAIGIGAGLGAFIFIAIVAILTIFMRRRQHERERSPLPSHTDPGCASVVSPPQYGGEGSPEVCSSLHEHFSPIAEGKEETPRAGSVPSELDATRSVQTNKT